MRQRSKKETSVALLSADWHLQHTAPIWRSAEPDWYAAMRRVMFELQQLQERYHCPILEAGDIFNRWNSCPQLINFAMAFMPKEVYSIVGQHDLPHHRESALEQSAYYSLVLGKAIKELGWAEVQPIRDVNLYAFPYGQEIVPPNEIPTEGLELNGTIDVAICHEYVWSGSYKYLIASPEDKIETRFSKLINGKLYGYDVIVYSSNHKGFLVKVGKTTVFNCGTLMRRKFDEKDYRPQIGLLYADGTVEPYNLDISKDQYIKISREENRIV